MDTVISAQQGPDNISGVSFLKGTIDPKGVRRSRAGTHQRNGDSETAGLVGAEISV